MCVWVGVWGCVGVGCGVGAFLLEAGKKKKKKEKKRMLQLAGGHPESEKERKSPAFCGQNVQFTARSPWQRRFFF